MDRKIERDRAEVFVNHIKKHLFEDGEPPHDVICKICNKTIDEIWDIETKKEHHLFVQPGIYEDKKVYMDRNGTPFFITRGILS